MSNIYGLLGEKLGHSLSPAIHKMLFKELEIDASYHLFEVEKNELKTAVYGLKALGFRGVNVTIPYKIDVMEYLDEISEEAVKIGAVNTILFEGNRLKGYNTDYYGFGMLLKKNGIETVNKSAVVLGSGGSAKSVFHYLADNGISDITVVSRNPSKLEAEFKGCRTMSYEELKNLEAKDIIINCTPAGMYPNINSSPVEKELLSKFKYAVDLTYNPSETLFLRYARENNAVAINGLYMLVGQAIKAEELWNDIKVSDETVEKIFIETSRLI